MTQFEYLYILLGAFTLILQAISVLHPLPKDMVNHVTLKDKEAKDINNERDV